MHVIEPATSGRAKCRGCSQPIAKGELRLGERLPNPYGDGDMTLWFHLLCGAYKRPEPLLEVLTSMGEEVADRERLESACKSSLAHRRVPRVDGAQRAPTGRARCRSCRELIAKDVWRIRLVYFDEGRFEPSGFIHAGCAQAYFETTDLIPRLRHFSPDIGDDDVGDLGEALKSVGSAGPPDS